MKVTWISHRGYKIAAVENTREAFQAAIDNGFTAIETDLRLTKDGHIVLHHDVSLARLGGIDIPVAQLTRSELSKVILREQGAWGMPLFLDQFVKEFPGCCWTFDVKAETALDTIRVLYDWSKKEGIFEWIAAQSKFLLWRKDHEDFLRTLFPHVSCYARERECWRAGLWSLLGLPQFSHVQANRVYSLPPYLGPISLYTKGLIDRFHRQGARVLAFLPESESEVRAACVAGVDEILTNGLPLQ